MSMSLNFGWLSKNTPLCLCVQPVLPVQVEMYLTVGWAGAMTWETLNMAVSVMMATMARIVSIAWVSWMGDVGSK